MPYYDYSKSGMYFVTMCVREMRCVLGHVDDGKTRLSSIGKIIEEDWQLTPKIRPNVKLDDWVIMPNHIHGIIVITHGIVGRNRYTDETGRDNNRFGPQSNHLPAIVRGFQSAAARRVHENGYHDFAWHSRIHDHIIRNEQDLLRIRAYIRDNQVKWHEDLYYRPNEGKMVTDTNFPNFQVKHRI